MSNQANPSARVPHASKKMQELSKKSGKVQPHDSNKLIQEPSDNVFVRERRDEGQKANKKDSRIGHGKDGQKLESF